MRRLVLVVLSAALSACPAGTPGQPGVKKSASPKVGASATPGTKPSASADVVPAGRAAVSRAPAGTRLLDTTVRADAGWIIANNGGSLISDNGLGAINVGGALISDNGLGVVSNNGGNLVVAEGQRLILNAGTLISDNGLGLTAKAKLVSDNGLGIIANNGGGFVTRTRYGLAQAAAPMLGTALPAAGMVVGLIDPRTGAPVPVGIDEAGQPVYAVFSDAAGRVQLHIAPDLPGNLRLVVFPATGADKRLRFNAFVANGDGAPKVDDDEAQVAAFLRGIMSRRLATMYMQNVTGAGGVQNGLIPPGLVAKAPGLASLAQPLADRMRGFLDDVGGAKASPRRLEALMLLLADRVITDMDLAIIIADASGLEDESKAEPKPAVETVRAIFKRVAEGAAVRLREAPRWFDDKPYVIEASRRRMARGGGAYAIRKPTDLVELLVIEFMGSNESKDATRLYPAFGDIGLTGADVQRLRVAGEVCFLAIGSLLVTGTTQLDGLEVPLVDALETLARAQGPAVLGVQDPPPAAVDAVVPPVSPPAATPTVTTLAGDGTRGSLDGPGAAASFDDPFGLALDGDRLLVQDLVAGKLRAISLTDPAHPVTTIANVPGTCVARDASGRIFVASSVDHRVRMITPGAAGPEVRIIAGDGQAGTQDGAGSAARFDDPFGMVVDPAGDLYITEHLSRRIRRIKISDPAFPVDTILDSEGPIHARFGPRINAATGRLFGVNVDPAGQLVFIDSSRSQVRRRRADGVFDLLAGIDGNGYTDDYYMAAEFNSPSGLVYDRRGRLIVADTFNHVLRLISPTGDVSTWAGGIPLAPVDTLVTGGFADGPGDRARFNEPLAMVAGPDGTIYLVDRANRRIRAITPAD